LLSRVEGQKEGYISLHLLNVGTHPITDEAQNQRPRIDGTHLEI